ncbi:MAG: hypothetical protein HY888_09580 [Deltaproteobacteria bacterium]|nr:hypothetical protein [Deltaproteobacteria bacterium]
MEKLDEDIEKFHQSEQLAQKLAGQPKLRYKKTNAVKKTEYSIVGYYPEGE